MLTAWHEFYGLLGTAAAALVALLFVAVSIATDVLTTEPESRRNTATYMTPVVFHYANILFLSLIALIPTQTWESFGIVIAAASIGSFGYSLLVHDARAPQFRFQIFPTVWAMAPCRCCATRRAWYPRGSFSTKIPRGSMFSPGGAAASRHQYPQRLGSDDFAGAAGEAHAERPASFRRQRSL